MQTHSSTSPSIPSDATSPSARVGTKEISTARVEMCGALWRSQESETAQGLLASYISGEELSSLCVCSLCKHSSSGSARSSCDCALAMVARATERTLLIDALNDPPRVLRVEASECGRLTMTDMSSGSVIAPSIWPDQSAVGCSGYPRIGDVFSATDGELRVVNVLDESWPAHLVLQPSTTVRRPGCSRNLTLRLVEFYLELASHLEYPSALHPGWPC